MKVALLLLLSFFATVLATAQERCPKIIADRQSGTYFTQSLSKNNRFQCFSNPQQARRAGFSSQQAIRQASFTDWYRLRLMTTVANTCESKENWRGLGALFLQLKESNGAVFGDFCPLLGEMNGVRIDNRVVLVRSQDFGAKFGIDSSAPNPCPDGVFRETIELTLERVVDGGTGFSTTYRSVRRCLSEQYADLSCVNFVRGIAFRETHPIWPEPPSNINQFTAGCKQALTTCAECHPGIFGKS